MSISIRHATADDQPHIRALARGERIKPTGIDWPRFVVAVDAGKVIGAVQLRTHPDGSKELGSLVVAQPYRRRGVAARLIEARLADTRGRVFIITGRTHADYYGRWGFRRIRPGSATAFVCLNFWLGYLGGGLIALLRGRAVNHLAVYERGTAGST